MRRSLFLLFLLSFAACQEDGTEKLFTSLKPEKTGLKFSNDLVEDDRFNIIKYLYFYNGGGVAIGDVNNDELPDIFLTANQLPNRLFLNRGEMKFEDVTESAGLLPSNEPGNRWKTGVTMADVNADGWLDIYVCEVGFYKSVSGRNRLYVNNKNGTFNERAEEFGLDFRGFSQQAAFFDYDLDGDLDCFLLNHSTHSAESFSPAANRNERDEQAGDRLYRNDSHLSPIEGRGVFTDVSEQTGIFGGPMGYGLGVVISDLNSDGWPDIYVTNDFHENDYLYLNSPPESPQSGGRTFREVIASATGHTSTFSMGVDAADVNNDGLTDLMTLDMRPPDEPTLKASAGIDHYNLQQMKLKNGYHAQFPTNTLQLAALGSGQSSPLEPVPNSLREAGGAGGIFFQDVAYLTDVAATDWSWGPLLADFDGDGWKDIFITNGIWRRPNDLDYLNFASDEEVKRQATDQELAAKMPEGKVRNFAFRNLASHPPAPLKGGLRPAGIDDGNVNGQKNRDENSPNEKKSSDALSPLEGGREVNIPTFQNVSEDWGLDLHGCSNGAAYADLDNDGDLDLVVNNLNAPASIFQNNSDQKPNRNYLKIKLVGNQQNLFGIGAKVIVKAGGAEQMQELSPTRGWQSSCDHVLVFGLAANEKVDEVKAVWPGGWTQVLTDVQANQTLTLQAVDALEQAPAETETQPIFTLVDHSDAPLPTHRENRFTDFNVEPLLPWMLSTQEPKIETTGFRGSPNWLYFGGAKGMVGETWRLDESGKLVKYEQPGFANDFLAEDVAVAFLDADGDANDDLYVVSGGGEYREGAPQLRDRLYRNTAIILDAGERPSPVEQLLEGAFEKNENALPDFATNGSTVLPFDFDGDMDLDLFVGSRSIPGSYGLSPKSFLLKNDPENMDEIRFTDATAEVCPALSDAGMVTSAVWLWREQRLVIASEWSNLQIFDFSKTPTQNSPLKTQNSSGLWQTLEAGDFDGDGDLDLLAGNIGLNTPLTASPQEPLELFAMDFDENEAIDPIVTWYRDGKRYPMVTKDALVQQLPFLRKKYVGYTEFANATFEEIFDKKIYEAAVHRQVTELRSMHFENLGDGKFEAAPLPMDVQVSPIHAFLVEDFDGDGNLDALAVGNFHSFRPDLGQGDASYGHFLKGDGKGNFKVLPPSESGFFVPGEARDLALLRGEDGAMYVVVARNDAEVLIFRKVPPNSSSGE